MITNFTGSSGIQMAAVLPSFLIYNFIANPA